MANIKDGIQYQSREAWLAARRNHIGGSEAAIICGVSPWGSRFDIWAMKVQGIVPPDNENMYWGRAHESTIIKRFKRDHPSEIIIDLEHMIFLGKPGYPDISHMACSPDALVVDSDGRILAIIEVKTTREYLLDLWGDEKSDQVPDYVLVQGLHGAIVVEAPQIIVLLLAGNSTYREYYINRDLDTEETERRIIETERQFMNDHIIAKVEPDYGDSPIAADYIKKRWPEDVEPIFTANERESAAIEELKIRYLAHKKATLSLNAQKNEIKALIGNRAGLDSQYGRITHKKIADSIAIDWELVASHLAKMVPACNWDAIVEEYTTIKKGYRRLNMPRAWGKD